MNKSTKILLRAVISADVAAQLLYGLNPKKWIITSKTNTEMKAVSRYSGIVCVLNKKRGDNSE